MFTVNIWIFHISVETIDYIRNTTEPVGGNANVVLTEAE